MVRYFCVKQDVQRYSVSIEKMKMIKRLLVVGISLLVGLTALPATSNAAVANTAIQKPEAPVNFAVEKYGKYNKAKLTWSKVPGVKGYKIYRATSENGKYKKIKTIKKAKKTSYINKKLKSRGVYFYKIRAYKKVNGKTYNGVMTEAQRVVVKYEITGKSDVKAADLAAYFKKSGHRFPKYYKKTDTPTLKSFCQAYIDEATAEGIKPEVAFAQSMLETGWLTFRGDVSIRQHNFAGLGAVGGGARGCSFSTVHKGIRAQVQHLKAYANKKKLRKKCVDKRFGYVTRGICAYVEWLGIPDNPYHVGWAATRNYGYVLVKMICQI